MKRVGLTVWLWVLGLLGWAAPTYTLRFNHVLGPNHPYHAGFQTWAERVAQRTGGAWSSTAPSLGWKRTSLSSSARGSL